MKAEIGTMLPHAWDPGELEEAGRILPWGLGRDRGPIDTWI